MIKLKYNNNIDPIVSTSFFKEAAIKTSQFFIKRKDNFINIAVDYSNNINFESYIYKISELKTGFRVKANTTDILVTNIVVNSVPYFYEIILVGGYLTADQIRLNSSIQFIEVKGHYYTNTVIVNQEVTEGVYAHTQEVYREAPSVKYLSKDIELTYISKDYLYFRPKNLTVISPILINDSKVYIPSFYVTTFDNKVLKCIEGDIQYINKREATYKIGNSIKCKDLCIRSDNDMFYNKTSNSFYTNSFNFVKDYLFLNYVAKKSSHILNLDLNKTYFKISNQGLIIADSSSYDFIITKTINPYNLEIIDSKFLTEYYSSFKPEDFILSKTVMNSNDKVSFKKEVNVTFNKNPSNTYYVEVNDKFIYQDTNSYNLENIVIHEDEDVEGSVPVLNGSVDSFKKLSNITDSIIYIIKVNVEEE